MSKPTLPYGTRRLNSRERIRATDWFTAKNNVRSVPRNLWKPGHTGFMQVCNGYRQPGSKAGDFLSGNCDFIFIRIRPTVEQ